MPQAETVALPKQLPLVIQPENRSESTDKDAKLVNCYMERSKETGESHLYKKPGTLQTATTISGVGLGVYNWLGDIYRIQGATMYKNDVALVGVLDTTGGVYRFSQCLGTTRKLTFGNGVAAYNYDGTSGIVAIGTTFTETAGDFTVGVVYTIVSTGTTNFVAIGSADNNPGTIFTATGVGSGTGTASRASYFPLPFVKGFAYLDGTTYVMDSMANIYGDAVLNEPDNWTDILNKIVAQIEPDGGVALAHQLVYVVAFKEWSTEIFYDALNATGSPLGPVQGAKVNYGCINQDGVQQIDGDLFWPCTNRDASAQVMMMSNLKATIVSTKPIDRLLEAMDLSSVLSFGIKYGGHRFYGLTAKNSNVTLVYDAAENLWAQWTDSAGNYVPWVSNTYTSSQNRIIQHESNGKLYLFDAAYTNDDGAIIISDIYTPNFDGGTDRKKFMKVMKFLGDETAGSELLVRFNDHDYKATGWTNFRTVDMSVENPMLTDCGTFKRRATHIRHKKNTRMRLAGVGLQLDLCAL